MIVTDRSCRRSTFELREKSSRHLTIQDVVGGAGYRVRHQESEIGHSGTVNE